MSPVDKERLLGNFNGNLPADVSLIRQFEATTGVRLPEDYAHFLQEVNGGEGFLGSAYVLLWRAEELSDMNKAYQVAEYAPGLFLFGSDGGGEAFAFDTRSSAKPIVSIPFVGMELKSVRPVASNFKEFLEALFRS